MARPSTLLAIDHIVLRAADPAALERSDLDVLGLTLEARQGKLAQLRAGSGLIDIVPADGRGQPGHIEHRWGQPRSPVPTGRAVRRSGDRQPSCPARRRLRSGDLAQRCRRQGPIDLPARSGRQRRRAQGTGHRWGAITKPSLRGCARLGPIAQAHCPRRRLPRERPRMKGAI